VRERGLWLALSCTSLLSALCSMFFAAYSGERAGNTARLLCTPTLTALSLSLHSPFVAGRSPL